MDRNLVIMPGAMLNFCNANGLAFVAEAESNSLSIVMACERSKSELYVLSFPNCCVFLAAML